MANKGYKYRLYPDEKQQVQLSKTFGCARFVYNQCLSKQETNHTSGEKYISKRKMNDYCNHVLKEEYPFLREVDKFALTNAVFHLDDAYARMFSHLGKHPNYKSKHTSRSSYTTNYTNGNIKVLEKEIQLPKLGKVKAAVHRKAPEEYKLKSATVSMEKDGTYYVSILYEYSAQPIKSDGDKVIGLDYKSDGLYVSSEGKCCDMPHYFRKSEPVLVKEQRRLSRMIQGSNNWMKQKRRVAKVHRHISNQRRDYLHKESAEIANQYDIVSVEDLDMKAMSNKGFRNGKATMDNGYGMFLSMLEYKLSDRGKTLVKVDKWYPSSQLCHVCGNRQAMPISVRTYRCPCCGMEMDRDVNAAINIKNEGLRIAI